VFAEYKNVNRRILTLTSTMHNINTRIHCFSNIRGVVELTCTNISVVAALFLAPRADHLLWAPYK